MATISALREGAVVVCLCLTAGSCVAGALGMWRMRTPTQALHYTGLPGTVGAVSLVAAVFLQAGNSSVAWATVLIALVLLAVNSASVHAAARAFRARDLGHWEPRDGDPGLEKFRETAVES